MTVGSIARTGAKILVVPQMAFVARTILLRVLLLCPWMFFSYPPSAYGQQTEQIEWQDEKYFTEADRTAIPRLARIMGVQNPKRVYHGESVPSLCAYTMVESTYSDSGHLRTYLQLMVHRRDSKCMTSKRGKGERVGRWFAYSAQLETRREWKIEEDRWVKYLSFGDGVSYKDAELIVLAIKHGQLVNRLPENSISSQLPRIDPMKIISVRVKTGAARTFEVWTSEGGSGKIYLVKIDDGKAELHEIQIWIA
jgi:hypothetical protein